MLKGLLFPYSDTQTISKYNVNNYIIDDSTIIFFLQPGPGVLVLSLSVSVSLSLSLPLHVFYFIVREVSWRNYYCENKFFSVRTPI